MTRTSRGVERRSSVARIVASQSELDAERVAAFVAEKTSRAHGVRALQGARRPPLALTSQTLASESVHVGLVATTRLACFPESAARALVGWATGTRRAVLLTHVPSPLDIVAFQAEGRRCVSIVGDDVPTAPHADALAFAVHDLCHLEKFFDPEHHLGEVGFSRAIIDYASSEAGRALDARLDGTWLRDRDAVVADMNGSAVFLFAALKMKLKMASRRAVARVRGTPLFVNAVLDAEECAAFERDRTQLFEALALPEAVAAAAANISTKRDAKDDALRLLAYFEELGAVPRRCRTAS